ncbi:MAG: DUF1211 domain-containing protein [Asticcacaulis sp.]|nr:DUF1211 domain-containing protein [Asticcacaulis sp.]
MSEAPVHRVMTKGRLEAFSDGVIAVIITIMVLELKKPAGLAIQDLLEVAHIMGLYALSFVYVGIYWSNHHHLMHAVHRVTGGVLWANLHLLFWLSLVPFTTGWMGESNFASLPTAIYGVSLITPAFAWLILQRTLIAANGRDSELARALGADIKGMVSPIIYLAGIGLSLWHRPLAGLACYVLVALIWLVPDRRIERLS